MSSERTVGVLGLGSMGMGVALTLVEHQFAVRGYDVRQEAMDSLVEAGGAVGKTPADVVAGCGTVIILVVNARQVEEVLFGENGAVAGMAKGTVVLQAARCRRTSRGPVLNALPNMA